MIKIAHRGNRNGKTISENQLWYLQEAISEGFDVEADIWMIGSNLWLGHDSARYLLNEDGLKDLIPNSWFHCKNLEVLDYLIDHHPDAKFFWHQNDNYALTSNGYIWTYPGKDVTKNSIIVNFNNDVDYDCYGVCSDYWK